MNMPIATTSQAAYENISDSPIVMQTATYTRTRRADDGSLVFATLFPKMPWSPDIRDAHMCAQARNVNITLPPHLRDTGVISKIIITLRNPSALFPPSGDHVILARPTDDREVPPSLAQPDIVSHCGIIGYTNEITDQSWRAVQFASFDRSQFNAAVADTVLPYRVVGRKRIPISYSFSPAIRSIRVVTTEHMKVAYAMAQEFIRRPLSQAEAEQLARLFGDEGLTMFCRWANKLGADRHRVAFMASAYRESLEGPR